MAVQITAVWRVRTAGNNANGGGYDAAVGGAGTDYSDQDAAQLSLADVVTTGTTTVTSATGGFTAAMVGNCIRISGDNYYFITARASTNSITVDRATGTGTGQSAKVGGAWADPWTNFSSGGGIGAAPIACPVVNGNVVYVRGGGTDDPSSPDYVANDYCILKDLNQNNLPPGRFVGYNGRPHLRRSGSNPGGLQYYLTANWTWDGFKFSNGGSTHLTQGIVSMNGSGQPYSGAELKNCYFDANGQDGVGCATNCVINCKFVNTGGDPGTYNQCAIMLGGFPGNVTGTRIDGWPGRGITTVATTGQVVTFTEIVNCKSHGIDWGGSAYYGAFIAYNTIDANLGDGLHLDTGSQMYGLNNTVIVSNNITNHTGSGKAGIRLSDPANATEGNRFARMIDYNNLYNNTSHYVNLSAGAHDTSVDPGYTGGGDYTPSNTATKVGYPTSLP